MSSHDSLFACDECQCPAELTELVPFKGAHICRLCFERHHPPVVLFTKRADGDGLATNGSVLEEDWPVRGK